MSTNIPTNTPTHVFDIARVEFGFRSAEEIRKIAVCKLDSVKLTGPGSVYDERLGYTPETDEKCVTCGLKRDCQGHPGYIELVEPILHPMLCKKIADLLRCFCKQCHRLLITGEQLELCGLSRLTGEKRFARILEKLEKNDLCSRCGEPQPKIVFRVKEQTISMEYKQKKRGRNTNSDGKLNVMMSTDEILNIFDSIPREDIITLGWNPDRICPKNMILTAFPVMPPCSRPYAITDGNTCDDDLTYQYIEIIKCNNQLLALSNVPKTPATDEKREKLIYGLKFRISTLMNNSKGRAHHQTDRRPYKGIKERLVGKDGRIRNHLMGKRVDYSARTVIDSDPTLKLNQVGIPQDVARILTKPEVVTPYNIRWLTEIVNTERANFLTTTTRRESGEEKVRINLHYARMAASTDNNNNSGAVGSLLMNGDIIVRGKGNVKVDDRGKLVLTSSSSSSDEKDEKHSLQFLPVLTGKEKLEPTDRVARNGRLCDQSDLVKTTCPNKKKHITLKIGDVVERHLMTGDIVVMNRQPTLHRGGMMTATCVVMPHRAFRLNLAQTKSYNADFDGDEMNLHAPQSYEAEAELRTLMLTSTQIITAQESKPIITITQDSLVASFLMTRYNMTLTRAQFCDITMKGEHVDQRPLYEPKRLQTIERILKQHGKPCHLFQSRNLLSLLLPPTFNYEKKNDAHPEEKSVKIVQGVFLEGAIDKSIVGSAHGSIIQLLNKEYGVEITANFIDNMQFVANAWLLVHGFSVGLEDCMITSEQNVLEIKNALAFCYTKAASIENTTQNPGIREVRVTAALSQAKDVGTRIARNAMRPDNNFIVTVTSGAKGDYFNIAQLTGLLGQQNLEGQRVTPTINHGKRSLPHYPFGTLDKEREYESRGFVQHSFIHGLTPEEFFFHAMSGREGVCDTALSTAQSGYIQRKIVKVCEDIQVHHDGTVRDNFRRIYQFAYGENNLDPIKTVKVDTKPQICDIRRLADKLNTSLEAGLVERTSFLRQPPLEFSWLEEEGDDKVAVMVDEENITLSLLPHAEEDDDGVEKDDEEEEDVKDEEEDVKDVEEDTDALITSKIDADEVDTGDAGDVVSSVLDDDESDDEVDFDV